VASTQVKSTSEKFGLKGFRQLLKLNFGSCQSRWYKYVWLGVSVEDRRYGVPRIDYLRQVDARVRFLSVEPLLEDVGEMDLTGIHWVIVGGESGAGARPMKPEWVERVKQQADESGAAFFFKQWGGWGADGVKRHKKANGRMFAGQTWDDYPQALQLSL
jgi:protein gp37